MLRFVPPALLVLICFFAFGFVSSVDAASRPAILYGDLNLDNHVTMDDVSILAQVVAGRQSLPNGVDPSAADLFADSIIDYKDLSILLDYVHGNFASVPITPNGSNTPVMFGDINGSGTISVSDLAGLANRLSNPNAPYLAKYDCYLDGHIDAVDLRVLANRLAGNIPSALFIPISLPGHRITPQGFVVGDVDGDGTVDLSDSFMLQAMLIQNETPPPAADLNDDGIINSTDLSLLNDLINI